MIPTTNKTYLFLLYIFKIQKVAYYSGAKKYVLLFVGSNVELVDAGTVNIL